MKRYFASLLFSLLGLAAAQKAQTVYINGQPIQAMTTNVNGKPGLAFVTSDLQKTGALTQGGSKPVDAIQGCKGQTLFNGVLRVTLLDTGIKGDDYVVTIKAINATNKDMNPAVKANFGYSAFWLADDNGSVARMSPGEVSSNRDLLPGSMVTTEATAAAKNSSDAVNFTPTRVLWRPESSQVDNDLPWAKVRNMEFRLNCKK